MNLKLGKQPARRDAVKFKLAKYTDETALPTPPLRFGHFGPSTISSWGVLLNDKIGNCTVAGAEHQIMAWSAAAGKPVSFSNANALADYRAITGYDPRDPNTDTGAELQTVASYWQHTGFIDAAGKRHKIDAYAELRAGDWDQLMLAAYLFGSVGVGVTLPKAAETLFEKEQIWDAVPSRVIGGHLIPVFGRNSKGNGVCVTWGRLQAMTQAWYEKYNDESIAYISFDALNDKLLTPEGFDIGALRKDLKAL